MVETEVAALIAPWLTPTSLFVLLNIVLATIFLANNKHHSKNKDDDNDENNRSIGNNTKSYSNQNNYDNQYDYYQSNQRYEYEGASLVPPPPQLVRAPSLFSRVASFNFSNFYSEAAAPPSDVADQTVTVTRAPSLLYRVTSFNFSRTPAPQKAEGEEARDVSQSHVRRENDEREEEVEAVKVKKKVNKNNKKVKKEVTEVKKEVKKEVAEVVKETASSRRVDEEVDSKADDFINRFKQQLKLQRLESLLRYRSDPAAT